MLIFQTMIFGIANGGFLLLNWHFFCNKEHMRFTRTVVDSDLRKCRELGCGTVTSRNQWRITILTFEREREAKKEDGMGEGRQFVDWRTWVLHFMPCSPNTCGSGILLRPLASLKGTIWKRWGVASRTATRVCIVTGPWLPLDSAEDFIDALILISWYIAFREVENGDAARENVSGGVTGSHMRGLGAWAGPLGELKLELVMFA